MRKAIPKLRLRLPHGLCLFYWVAASSLRDGDGRVCHIRLNVYCKSKNGHTNEGTSDMIHELIEDKIIS